MDITMIMVLVLLLLLGTAVYGSIKGAPWVPTRGHDVERFLKLSDIRPGQKVYDLGCGDGRMVCAAAEVGAQAQGFEISLLPYFLAKIRSLFCGASRSCKIRYRDFWNVSLGDADVVYFFLMRKCYPKLKEKLERELKPGTKVIAYVWPISGWAPIRVMTEEKHPALYLYQM